MSVRLFVGGLAFTTSTDGLRDAFARFGPVQSAAVMTDRETGRSRGFGFVEMASEQEAERAISALNGSSLDGRMIRVDKATPRGAGGPPRPRPAGGFGGPRPDRPAGGGFAPRPGGGGGYGPRPGGGGVGPRVGGGGGGGWTPPAPEQGRGGNRRGDRRAGPPGPAGEQGRPKKPGSGRKSATPQDRRGGRGRLGSDGDYRWGR
jgi:RNA recognition motif-containing protein